MVEPRPFNIDTGRLGEWLHEGRTMEQIDVLPETVEGIREWLGRRGIDVEEFKASQMYRDNLERHPQLKDL